MKTIICDECVPLRLMDKLSQQYDILRPIPATPDSDIIHYADHFDYPIITYDMDFAEYDKSIILQYGVADKSCSKFIKKSIKKFEKFKN